MDCELSLFSVENPQEDRKRAEASSEGCSRQQRGLRTTALLAACGFTAHLYFWYAVFPRSSHQSTSKKNITKYENLLERTVVRANFLNPDVAFSRNERLRSGVGVRESYNARDVLETTVVVHTNLKEKRKHRYRTIPVISSIWKWLLVDYHWESADSGAVDEDLISGIKRPINLVSSLSSSRTLEGG